MLVMELDGFMNNQPPTNRDKLEETVYSHIEGAYHNGHFDARWSAKEDDEVQRFRVDQIMAEVEAYTEKHIASIEERLMNLVEAQIEIMRDGIKELDPPPQTATEAAIRLRTRPSDTIKRLFREASRPPEGGTNG